MRALLKVGRACNNDCTFCHASERGRDDPLERLVRKIAAARALGAATVVLSGGEPTLRRDLLDIADVIKAQGMTLGLVTNARRLADASLVDELMARGLEYAYVSLHGSRAEVHDPLVGATAFDETLRAIRNLHGRVDQLAVNAVVTHGNLHDLRNIVDLLAPLERLQLKFTMPQPKGAAREAFDNVVPSLTQASAATLDALTHALSRLHARAPERYGHEGFPLCLLPGLKHLQSNLRSHGIHLMSEPEDETFELVDDVLLTKPQCCDRCVHRVACPGIYKVYAQFRGAHELRPIEANPHQPSASDDPRLREQASQEKRAWVRLTFACNNRCLFCLDRETGSFQARPADEIRKEIIEGRKAGADRLILSGGEATTHPKFIEFIKLGRLAGYRWVQTITNGRMFSYPKFLSAALGAGLNEMTVSMHGHTAELHDKLVGVDGAFEQAKRGLRTALGSGKVVVNIDVVINAHNVAHLPEMLETFVGWGVHEFDLLHIVPFGNAWREENRHLFYDLSEHAESLSRAMAFSRREGIHMWLNRFPPAYAEGFEGLIQDPYKLHDEIRGRAAEFATYLAGGQRLPCFSEERCERCYLNPTCSALERARVMLDSPRLPMVRISASAPHTVRGKQIDLLEVHAVDAAGAAKAVEDMGATRVRLELDNISSLNQHLDSDGKLAGAAVEALVLRTRAQVEQAALLAGDFDLRIELRKETAGLVSELTSLASRIVLVQPSYDRVGDALDNDVDLDAELSTAPSAVRTASIAACMGGRAPETFAEPLDARVVNEDGAIDADKFVSFFVSDIYFVKSLRCKGCAHDSKCRGMHINWVRAHGFAGMKP